MQQALEQIAGSSLQHTATLRNGEPSSSPLDQYVILEASSRGALQRLGTQGFTGFHRFSVLPSRAAPRWLLPLGSSSVTRQSLGICATYSPRARAMKSVLSAMTKMNWFEWARSGIVLASKRPLALEALVAEVTGETAPVFALSLSGRHQCRKVAVQVMRPTGEILGYIKLPLTEAAAERVRHEAEILSKLWGFADLRPHIPRVLHAGQWRDSYILFQSSGPAGMGPQEIGRAHEEFLLTFQNVHRVEKPGRSIAAVVQRRWERLEAQLDAEVQQLGRSVLLRVQQQLDGCTIRCGIHHGDFAPWNTRVENGRLFLFDWESASFEAPACWDAMHFRIQVEGLLKKKDDGRSVESLRKSHGPEFLLYLLNSLCQLLEEDPEDRRGIEYRLRLLRESVQVPCSGNSSVKLLGSSRVKTSGGSAH